MADVPAAIVARLRAAGCVLAEDEAAMLVSSAVDATELEAMVARRVGGEPLEHVVGWAGFRSGRVAVGPGVFVPRRRSEWLVEVALALVAGRASTVVLDLCAGSGALGVAVAAEAATAVELHAAELEPAALACLRRNLPPGARAYAGDLFAPLSDGLRARVDLLIANAPYVPAGDIAYLPGEARDHEPRRALDGGSDGLDVHRRIAAEARAWLAPRGHLLIETGENQAATAAALFERGGLRARVHTSPDAEATVVVGTAPGALGRAGRDLRR